MIRHKNENGSVNVSTSVYTDIAGTVASNCFGVKGTIHFHLIINSSLLDYNYYIIVIGKCQVVILHKF